MSPEDIRAVTGHTTAGMMMKYVKVDDESKREKMNLLNNGESHGVDTIYPKYELLCTHTGRKTFICKALICKALSLGIPPNVVMKWTGHSDYKAMKPYIDIADSIKVNAMSRFD